MSGDNYDLTWNDFGRNAERTFQNLASDSRFTDVTLISDDRIRIKAHKIILSSCSNFFNQILSETSTENPLLFLKGIHHFELEAIVKFIYMGTTEVSQEHLDKFMRAATDLQIEGLQNRKKDENIHENGIDYQKINTNEDYSYYSPKTKHQEFDLTTKQNTIDSSAVLPAFKTRHFERKGDGSYFCDKCDYKTTILSNLKSHILSKHEGVKFKCDQCFREFSSKTNLQTHIHSKHEGKKYTCEQCTIEFSSPAMLSNHKTKHHRYLEIE